MEREICAESCQGSAADVARQTFGDHWVRSDKLWAIQVTTKIGHQVKAHRLLN